MWAFIRSRKSMAVILFVVLLGGGFYGGSRLLGTAVGDSGEWTTLNEEISAALKQNDGDHADAMNGSAQGPKPDHRESGKAASSQTGSSQREQRAEVVENRTDALNHKPETGSAASTGGQTQGQEEKNAAGGMEAGGAGAGDSAAEGGSSNRQQAENASGSKSSHGLVDINSASVSRLTDLPGIGESKARAIVEYRKQNGGFRSREELMKVKGIGQKTFDKLKERITISLQ